MSWARRLLLPAVAGLALLAGCSSDPGDAGGAPGVSNAEVTANGCTTPPPSPAEITTYDSAAAPTAPSDSDLVATISTNCGEVQVDLFGDLAPVTVASFELLAGSGYWDQSPCHRLTTAGIHVLQCGDPTGTGRGGPGYTFGIENAPADGRYPAGTVAMARSQDPNSNGGQFFIVQQDTELPVRGGGYSIFGKVTSGMEVIDRIAGQGVLGGGSDGAPAQPVSILSVEVKQGEASSS